MSLLVVRPGPAATIQDLGRDGYREWGVPPGGAFDRGSLILANALVGNPPQAAALELTLFGGLYRAEADLAMSFVGADMAIQLEGVDGGTRPLAVPSATNLPEGASLRIGAAARGVRLYLAVRGGWQTEPVLGSRSCEVPLRAGDRLPARPGATPTRRLSVVDVPSLRDGPFRVLPGPDAGDVDLATLTTARFRVGRQSDRMGLRLEGPPIKGWSDRGRLSAPVAAGTVQVAGGQPIVLGVACGTMGGYPHVAQVISADLDRLGQCGPGAEIEFRLVDVEEARSADRGARRALHGRSLRVRMMATWALG